MNPNELPWDERVTMLQINPDAATRDDIARMAMELSRYIEYGLGNQHTGGGMAVRDKRFFVAPYDNGVPVIQRSCDFRVAVFVTQEEAQNYADYRNAMLLKYNTTDVLAYRLAVHEYTKGNPLGGPATLFDTIANRIRAGEDYYFVLSDYGLRFDDMEEVHRLESALADCEAGYEAKS